jgi:hypothetical protein
MSWRKQKRLNKETLVTLEKESLRHTTKIAELERYRNFLDFCLGNGWVSHNWASAKPAPGRKGIKLDDAEPKRKFPSRWTSTTRF